jgi:hypothetical protein
VKNPTHAKAITHVPMVTMKSATRSTAGPAAINVVVAPMTASNKVTFGPTVAIVHPNNVEKAGERVATG